MGEERSNEDESPLSPPTPIPMPILSMWIMTCHPVREGGERGTEKDRVKFD